MMAILSVNTLLMLSPFFSGARSPLSFFSTTSLGTLTSPVREDASVYPRQPPAEDREGAEFGCACS
jgi:hypothetical protein